MRLRLTILSLGLVLACAVHAHAQGPTLTINGSGSATLRPAPEFATDVLGDPWDFEQRSDYVYMYSENAVLNSAFQAIPDFVDGNLRGVVSHRGDGGDGHVRVRLLWEGIAGGFNLAGRNGITFPIDPRKYNRMSFRMRRSKASTSPNEAIAAMWWRPLLMAPPGQDMTQAAGAQHFLAVGAGGANQSPIARQVETTYHIYTMDLDHHVEGAPWDANHGMMGGIGLTLANHASLAGATLDLDWARLTKRGEATASLQWSGFGGRVTLTARNNETGDVIQIFPNTSGGLDFPSSQSFTWDYGFLPAGTWVITATAGSQTKTATLTIDPAPVVTVTEPDAAGGRDFATSTLGDAWDLTNPADITRFGRLFQIPTATLTEAGLDGITNGADPFVQFNGHTGSLSIPGATFHRLSFTLQYDHPELMGRDGLNDRWGGVARVVWNKSGGAVNDFRVTQDLVVMDGIPNHFALDLSTLDDPVTEMEPAPGALWGADMKLFRIDVNEALNARGFRLSNVRLATDDEPNGNGFFTIRWTGHDATLSRQIPGGNGTDAKIALFYDTDLDPGAKTAIASDISAAAGQYAWDMAGLQADVPYYVYIQVTDTHGSTQGRYSTGPVVIRTALPPGFRTDNNGNSLPDQWETLHRVTSPSTDEDADGMSNVQEYQAGTNPRISNVWNLPEGSTGFFTQRLALVNPDTAPADVTIKYLRANKPPVTREYSVLAKSRLTIEVDEIAGLTTEDVSAVITANSGGVLAERTMFWGDDLYGGHTGKAMQQARKEWFLAEGVAGDFFQTFILLANATETNAAVTLTFLREGHSPMTVPVGVGANSRVTVQTNDFAELHNIPFATRITSDVPIAVERAMYIKSNPARAWEGGHESAAVAEPKTEWYVAEGQASPFFAEFVLLANPNPQRARATVRYLMPGREPVTKVFDLEANSRFTIQIGNDDHAPGVHDTDVSVAITSDLPIVVERAMYWPANGARWTDGHNSAGVTSTGTTWALAEGEFGGRFAFASYILLANPTANNARVRLTLLREAGRPPLVREVDVPANQRLTVGADSFLSVGLQSGERFGIYVESLNEVPIVIERAMYWDGGGEHWGGGTNETGFKLR